MKHVEYRKKMLINSLLGFILLFFICYRMYYLTPGIAEHCGSCFLYPFLKLYHSCIDPIAQRFNQRITIAELTNQLATVQHANDALRAENIELKATTVFFQNIQELVDFKKRYDQSSMRIVQILARHTSPEHHFMYVDAGALSGITTNMIALYNAMIVGRVIEVYPWYSKVQLITDPECAISVYDAQTKTRGIYQGNGTTAGVVTHMSHLEHVYVGDELFSTGQGLLFPGGYLIGTIASCKTEGLYHTIHVTPAINSATIDYCMLLSRS